MSFTTFNPWTCESLQSFSYHSLSEVFEVIEQANAQQIKWKIQTPAQRALILRELSKALLEHKDALARSMALEMGKPIKEGILEVEKSASTLSYVSTHFLEFMTSKQIPAHYELTTTQLKSLGLILAFMPWNYPVWQVVRVAATSFLLGNVLVVKHSDLTAGTAQLLADVISKVHPLLFNVRFPHAMTDSVIAHKGIKAVTFTGSPRGGAEVAQMAGKHLKKVVLELGGSDGYAVFADADLEAAARICVQSRLVNNGQSCVAAKRFLVHSKVANKFFDLVVKQISQSVLGDPLDLKTDRGPLASAGFKKSLQELYLEHLMTGGKELFSETGEIFKKENLSFPVKIVQTSLHHNHFLNHEYFGPVIQWVIFQDPSEVVQAINQCRFGLGAALFSQDVSFCRQLAESLEVGMIAVNDSVRSDVRVPFGGVRDSGFGKELGLTGLLEFSNDQFVGISNL